jgi:hypothetical protein
MATDTGPRSVSSLILSSQDTCPSLTDHRLTHAISLTVLHGPGKADTYQSTRLKHDKEVVVASTKVSVSRGKCGSN